MEDKDILPPEVNYQTETFSQFRAKDCTVCTKSFIRLDWRSYTYKIRQSQCYLYFCSYGCVRKYEKEHQPPPKQLPVATDKEAKKKKSSNRPKKRQKDNYLSDIED